MGESAVNVSLTGSSALSEPHFTSLHDLMMACLAMANRELVKFQNEEGFIRVLLQCSSEASRRTKAIDASNEDVIDSIKIWMNLALGYMRFNRIQEAHEAIETTIQFILTHLHVPGARELLCSSFGLYFGTVGQFEEGLSPRRSDLKVPKLLEASFKLLAPEAQLVYTSLSDSCESAGLQRNAGETPVSPRHGSAGSVAWLLQNARRLMLTEDWSKFVTQTRMIQLNLGTESSVYSKCLARLFFEAANRLDKSRLEGSTVEPGPVTVRVPRRPTEFLKLSDEFTESSLKADPENPLAMMADALRRARDSTGAPDWSRTELSLVNSVTRSMAAMANAFSNHGCGAGTWELGSKTISKESSLFDSDGANLSSNHLDPNKLDPKHQPFSPRYASVSSLSHSLLAALWLAGNAPVSEVVTNEVSTHLSLCLDAVELCLAREFTSNTFKQTANTETVVSPGTGCKLLACIVGSFLWKTQFDQSELSPFMHASCVSNSIRSNLRPIGSYISTATLLRLGLLCSRLALPCRSLSSSMGGSNARRSSSLLDGAFASHELSSGIAVSSHGVSGSNNNERPHNPGGSLLFQSSIFESHPDWFSVSLLVRSDSDQVGAWDSVMNFDSISPEAVCIRLEAVAVACATKPIIRSSLVTSNTIQLARKTCVSLAPGSPFKWRSEAICGFLSAFLETDDPEQKSYQSPELPFQAEPPDASKRDSVSLFTQYLTLALQMSLAGAQSVNIAGLDKLLIRAESILGSTSVCNFSDPACNLSAVDPLLRSFVTLDYERLCLLAAEIEFISAASKAKGTLQRSASLSRQALRYNPSSFHARYLLGRIALSQSTNNPDSNLVDATIHFEDALVCYSLVTGLRLADAVEIENSKFAFDSHRSIVSPQAMDCMFSLATGYFARSKYCDCIRLCQTVLTCEYHAQTANPMSKQGVRDLMTRALEAIRNCDRE